MDVFQVFCVLFHPLVQIRLMYMRDGSELGALLNAPVTLFDSLLSPRGVSFHRLGEIESLA